MPHITPTGKAAIKVYTEPTLAALIYHHAKQERRTVSSYISYVLERYIAEKALESRTAPHTGNPVKSRKR